MPAALRFSASASTTERPGKTAEVHPGQRDDVAAGLRHEGVEIADRRRVQRQRHSGGIPRGRQDRRHRGDGDRAARRTAPQHGRAMPRQARRSRGGEAVSHHAVQRHTARTSRRPATPPTAASTSRSSTKATEMMNAGRFLTPRPSPRKSKIRNPPRWPSPDRHHALPGREIARRAAAGYLRAGWFFQCTKCGRWHTNLAGGYAIAGTPSSRRISHATAGKHEARRRTPDPGARRERGDAGHRASSRTTPPWTPSCCAWA